MQATITALPTVTATTSKVTRWIGRIISALAVLFLIFDGTIKVLNLSFVVDASQLLGLPVELAPTLGILLLACLAVYLFPRTSALGAILLTGYLGGAIAIQARVSAEPFSLIFPIILGALLWSGLLLRDAQVRALLLPRR
jgi:hypothetical protein